MKKRNTVIVEKDDNVGAFNEEVEAVEVVEDDLVAESAEDEEPTKDTECVEDGEPTDDEEDAALAEREERIKEEQRKVEEAKKRHLEYQKHLLALLENMPDDDFSKKEKKIAKKTATAGHIATAAATVIEQNTYGMEKIQDVVREEADKIRQHTTCEADRISANAMPKSVWIISLIFAIVVFIVVKAILPFDFGATRILVLIAVLVGIAGFFLSAIICTEVVKRRG